MIDLTKVQSEAQINKMNALIKQNEIIRKICVNCKYVYDYTTVFHEKKCVHCGSNALDSFKEVK